MRRWSRHLGVQPVLQGLMVRCWSKNYPWFISGGRCHKQPEFRAQSAIRAGRSDFKNLERVWRHANISLHRKIWIFDTSIGSQLLYCLHTAWLNRAGFRKLDGLHARSFRKIIGIQHSFISRVSTCDTGATVCFRLIHWFCCSIDSLDDEPPPPPPERMGSAGVQRSDDKWKHLNTWVVVKIMVLFWVP